MSLPKIWREQLKENNLVLFRKFKNTMLNEESVMPSLDTPLTCNSSVKQIYHELLQLKVERSRAELF